MIKIICVGKLKESFWKEAVLEYQKRLQKYGKLEIVEVNDWATDDPVITMEKERLEIEKQIKDKDFVIAMDIEGKQYTSLDFAQQLDKLQIQSSNLVFLIGGSCGLSQTLKKRSNMQISFSKMTFPHQLFRILLLEQIYRSFKINHHEAYHK